MRTHTTEVILIGREAHDFLQNEMRKQRGLPPMTPEQEDRVWGRIYKRKNTDMREVDDITYGGGDGRYYGRWWSWSVETIKEMLTKAGYSYEDGGIEEYIEV